MKTKSLLAGSIVLGLAAALSAAAPEGSASVDAAWTKAMKANDLNAVLACYAPGAVLWMPGEPAARGEKEIHDAYAAILSANTVQDVQITNNDSRTSRNVSAGWGNFSLTLAPKAGGSPIVMTGRFTEVAEKKSGRWLYVADHASADPVPAAKP